MAWALLRIYFVFVVFLFFSIFSNAYAFASGDLKILSATDVGMDEGRLSQAFHEAAQLKHAHSLLVLKDDALVREAYFNGYSRTSPNNLKSVSKSILSALVGIAIDQGKIKSVHTPLADFFPKIYRSISDPKKKALSLSHLLSMSTGLDASDGMPGFVPFAQLDRAAYLLNRPLIAEPGKRYSYCTQNTFLVSRILTESTGVSTYEFAQKNLFDPLGAKILGWPRDALGYYWGGHLFLTSRDLAKFGLLFLNRGKFQERRVLSEQWIEESTSPKIKGSEGNGQYGYFWWSRPDAKVPFYYAWGHGGQYIYVIPKKRMVIVMTNDFTEGRPQGAIRHIIEDLILGAAQ